MWFADRRRRRFRNGAGYRPWGTPGGVLSLLVVLAAGVPSVDVAGRTSVRIGLLVPPGAASGSLRDGADTAVRQVNSGGGIGGRSLELVTLEAARPWRDGASLAARLLAEDVVAVIGVADGAGAHVAAQVATRRRVPVLVLSPEDSLTQAGDPWVFRAVPADREQAGTLLRWAFGDPRGLTAQIVVPEGREGRERLASLRAACAELGVEIVSVWPPEMAETVDDCRCPGDAAALVVPPQVLLLWLDPEPALLFLQGQEEATVPAVLLGSSRLDVDSFRERLPRWAAGLALPHLHPDDHADVERALGHDLVQLVARAARRDGPDPAAVREALAAGEPLQGLSGVFAFDARGNRRGAFTIGTIDVDRRENPHE